ncbi:hypothetical protein Trydic_g12683 [Trypoxylus dichotomus]
MGRANREDEKKKKKKINNTASREKKIQKTGSRTLARRRRDLWNGFESGRHDLLGRLLALSYAPSNYLYASSDGRIAPNENVYLPEKNNVRAPTIPPDGLENDLMANHYGRFERPIFS